MTSVQHPVSEILEKLHIEPVNSGACYGDWIANPSGRELESISPATGEPIAKVKLAGPADYERVVNRARDGFPASNAILSAE